MGLGPNQEALEERKSECFLRLKSEVESKGRKLPEGWQVICRVRQAGISAGQVDYHYTGPDGTLYKSRLAVLKVLGVVAQPSTAVRPSCHRVSSDIQRDVILQPGAKRRRVSVGVGREGAEQKAKLWVASAQVPCPYLLNNGVMIVNLGQVTPLSVVQGGEMLLPIGFQSYSFVPQVGWLHCSISTTIPNDQQQAIVCKVQLQIADENAVQKCEVPPTPVESSLYTLAEQPHPNSAWTSALMLVQCVQSQRITDTPLVSLQSRLSPANNNPLPTSTHARPVLSSDDEQPCNVDFGVKLDFKVNRDDSSNENNVCVKILPCQDSGIGGMRSNVKQRPSMTGSNCGRQRSEGDAKWMKPVDFKAVAQEWGADVDKVKECLCKWKELSNVCGLERFGLLDDTVTKLTEGRCDVSIIPEYSLVDQVWEWADEYSSRAAYIKQCQTLSLEHGINFKLPPYSRQMIDLPTVEAYGEGKGTVSLSTKMGAALSTAVSKQLDSRSNALQVHNTNAQQMLQFHNRTCKGIENQKPVLKQPNEQQITGNDSSQNNSRSQRSPGDPQIGFQNSCKSASCSGAFTNVKCQSQNDGSIHCTNTPDIQGQDNCVKMTHTSGTQEQSGTEQSKQDCMNHQLGVKVDEQGVTRSSRGYVIVKGANLGEGAIQHPKKSGGNSTSCIGTATNKAMVSKGSHKKIDEMFANSRLIKGKTGIHNKISGSVGVVPSKQVSSKQGSSKQGSSKQGSSIQGSSKQGWQGVQKASSSGLPHALPPKQPGQDVLHVNDHKLNTQSKSGTSVLKYSGKSIVSSKVSPLSDSTLPSQGNNKSQSGNDVRVGGAKRLNEKLAEQRQKISSYVEKQATGVSGVGMVEAGVKVAGGATPLGNKQAIVVHDSSSDSDTKAKRRKMADDTDDFDDQSLVKMAARAQATKQPPVVLVGQAVKVKGKGTLISISNSKVDKKRQLILPLSKVNIKQPGIVLQKHVQISKPKPKRNSVTIDKQTATRLVMKAVNQACKALEQERILSINAKAKKISSSAQSGGLKNAFATLVANQQKGCKDVQPRPIPVKLGTIPDNQLPQRKVPLPTGVRFKGDNVGNIIEMWEVLCRVGSSLRIKRVPCLSSLLACDLSATWGESDTCPIESACIQIIKILSTELYEVATQHIVDKDQGEQLRNMLRTTQPQVQAQTWPAIGARVLSGICHGLFYQINDINTVHVPAAYAAAQGVGGLLNGSMWMKFLQGVHIGTHLPFYPSSTNDQSIHACLAREAAKNIRDAYDIIANVHASEQCDDQCNRPAPRPHSHPKDPLFGLHVPNLPVLPINNTAGWNGPYRIRNPRAYYACTRILHAVGKSRVGSHHTTTTSKRFFHCGIPVANAMKRGIPIDIHMISERLQAGVYDSFACPVSAMVMDLFSCCTRWRKAASAKSSQIGKDLPKGGIDIVNQILINALQEYDDKHAQDIAQSQNATLNGCTAHATDTKIGDGNQQSDNLLSTNTTEDIQNGQAEHEGGVEKCVSVQERTSMADHNKGPKQNGEMGSDSDSDTVDVRTSGGVQQYISNVFSGVAGCTVCWLDDDRKRLLVCDGCDDEVHLYCQSPMLCDVPDGTWLCPVCARQQSLTQHQASQLVNLQKSYYALFTEQCSGQCQGPGGGSSRVQYMQQLHHAVTIFTQKELSQWSTQDKKHIIRALLNVLGDSDSLRQHLNGLNDYKRELNKELYELQIKLKQLKQSDKEQKDAMYGGIGLVAGGGQAGTAPKVTSNVSSANVASKGSNQDNKPKIDSVQVNKKDSEKNASVDTVVQKQQQQQSNVLSSNNSAKTNNDSFKAGKDSSAQDNQGINKENTKRDAQSNNGTGKGGSSVVSAIAGNNAASKVRATGTLRQQLQLQEKIAQEGCKMDKVRGELNELNIRRVCLGYDRENNRYWQVYGNIGSFVQASSSTQNTSKEVLFTSKDNNGDAHIIIVEQMGEPGTNVQCVQKQEMQAASPSVCSSAQDKGKQAMNAIHNITSTMDSNAKSSTLQNGVNAHSVELPCEDYQQSRAVLDQFQKQEMSTGCQWTIYHTAKEIQQLARCMDSRGIKEKQLREELDKVVKQLRQQVVGAGQRDQAVTSTTSNANQQQKSNDIQTISSNDVVVLDDIKERSDKQQNGDVNQCDNSKDGTSDQQKEANDRQPAVETSERNKGNNLLTLQDVKDAMLDILDIINSCGGSNQFKQLTQLMPCHKWDSCIQACSTLQELSSCQILLELCIHDNNFKCSASYMLHPQPHPSSFQTVHTLAARVFNVRAILTSQSVEVGNYGPRYGLRKKGGRKGTSCDDFDDTENHVTDIQSLRTYLQLCNDRAAAVQIQKGMYNESASSSENSSDSGDDAQPHSTRHTDGTTSAQQEARDEAVALKLQQVENQLEAGGGRVTRGARERALKKVVHQPATKQVGSGTRKQGREKISTRTTGRASAAKANQKIRADAQGSGPRQRNRQWSDEDDDDDDDEDDDDDDHEGEEEEVEEGINDNKEDADGQSSDQGDDGNKQGSGRTRQRQSDVCKHRGEPQSFNKQSNNEQNVIDTCDDVSGDGADQDRKEQSGQGDGQQHRGAQNQKLKGGTLDGFIERKRKNKGDSPGGASKRGRLTRQAQTKHNTANDSDDETQSNKHGELGQNKRKRPVRDSAAQRKSIIESSDSE